VLLSIGEVPRYARDDDGEVSLSIVGAMEGNAVGAQDLGHYSPCPLKGIREFLDLELGIWIWGFRGIFSRGAMV
jgi:hypothetical protein